MRQDARALDQLRPVSFELGFTRFAVPKRGMVSPVRGWVRRYFTQFFVHAEVFSLLCTGVSCLPEAVIALMFFQPSTAPRPVRPAERSSETIPA